jgi:hypothetical protein
MDLSKNQASQFYFIDPRAVIFATGFPLFVTVISSPACIRFKTLEKFF